MGNGAALAGANAYLVGIRPGERTVICGAKSWPGWVRFWLTGRADPLDKPMPTMPLWRVKPQSKSRLLMHALQPLTIGLALSACSTIQNSDVNGCDAIKLVEYAPSTQAKVAAEMRAAGQNDYMPDWIKDYGGLRAQVRACQSVKH